MRHNEIRDTFASVMKEVCYDVEIEPKHQPLEGESFVHKTTTTEDEARLDIKANGLWDSRFCRTFFDVKIFNPLARTCPKNVNEAYKFHESQKKLKYEDEKMRCTTPCTNAYTAQEQHNDSSSTHQYLWAFCTISWKLNGRICLFLDPGKFFCC